MRFNNADIGITFIFCTICLSSLSGIFPCIFPLWQRGIEGDFLNKSILHKISPYPSFPKRGPEGFWTDPRRCEDKSQNDIFRTYFLYFPVIARDKRFPACHCEVKLTEAIFEKKLSQFFRFPCYSLFALSSMLLKGGG